GGLSICRSSLISAMIISCSLARQRRLCFFLSCHAADPDLHSFPTRRSSDLLIQRTERGPALQLLHEALGVLLEDERARSCLAVRDRKSTRLNSSHVAISYAVFCLKKKNMLGDLSAFFRSAAGVLNGVIDRTP